MRRFLKKFGVGLLTASMLAGCAKGQPSVTPPSDKGDASDNGVIELTMFAEPDSFDMLNEMFEGFKAQYPDKEINITLLEMGDAEAKNSVLGDIHGCADLFTYPDDQFSALLASGVLSPVPDQAAVSAANMPNSIEVCTYNNVLYGYPYTADNGYFVYYDKRYFKDSDLTTLDGILDVCEKNDKRFSMELNSGWYLYSFFGLTGLQLGINPDGVTNYCDWNSMSNPVRGADVTKAIYDIVARKGFVSHSDKRFTDEFVKGNTIAGISGTWNYATFKEALGNNLGAVKLPTYTVRNQQMQMASFTGYKIIGVNYYSENTEWAHKLAQWLTNEQNQSKRFEVKGTGPSNINAAASDEVLQNVAIKAILDQAQYASVQRVGSRYWDACTTYANNIINENPSAMTHQTQIDKLVREIKAGIN